MILPHRHDKGRDKKNAPVGLERFGKELVMDW